MLLIHAKTQNSLAKGQKPYQTQVNALVHDPSMPFRAEISHRPISHMDTQRLHQFCNTMLSGIFLGYARMVRRLAHRGLGRLGDTHRLRSPCQEIQVVPRSTSHHSSLNIHLSMCCKGEGHVVSRPPFRHRPSQKADAESGGNPDVDDTLAQRPQSIEREATEVKDDMWSFSGIYRHHVASHGQLNVPHESSFPIPLKYIDVNRQSWDELEKRSVDDFWKVEGHRTLSEDWIRFTRFQILQTRPPKDH